MTESITGVGQGSADGPLRGFDLSNLRRVYIKQGGNLLPCVYVIDDTSPHAGNLVLRAVGDGQFKIDDTDEIPGYFNDKIIPGIGIFFVDSPGPNKQVTINSPGDHKVAVDSGDTPDYLGVKILPGANVSFTTSVGPNKSITVNSSGGGGVNPNTLVSSFAYTCPSGVNINDLVYATNVATSVDQANATSLATAPALGFVVSKPIATNCVIAYGGEVSGFVGLVPGASYYIDTVNGGITNIPPSGAGNIIQRVGTAISTTVLVVFIDGFVEI